VRWPAAILLTALAVAAGVPVAAQEVGGGITTSKLEPLGPPSPGAEAEEGVGQVDRFKTAPFQTDGPARAPILIDPVETAERGGATIRQLDKMTGRTTTFEMQAGAEEVIERLRVRLDSCRSPEGNAQHGTIAYLEVWDTKDTDGEAVFAGWMFAESPALSAMDHPRYDLWVISCTTSSGGTTAAKE